MAGLLEIHSVHPTELFLCVLVLRDDYIEPYLNLDAGAAYQDALHA